MSFPKFDVHTMRFTILCKNGRPYFGNPSTSSILSILLYFLICEWCRIKQRKCKSYLIPIFSESSIT